jgi:hypothetical protein
VGGYVGSSVGRDVVVVLVGRFVRGVPVGNGVGRGVGGIVVVGG